MPEILAVKPELITIYLYTPLKAFDLLQRRMISRELAPGQTDVTAEQLKKIEARLEFAHKELQDFPKIDKSIRSNPQSRVFEIIDNNTLYQDVIPYIKSIAEK